MQKSSTVDQIDNHWILPGLATAHSHAFQRALRGRTQQHSTAATSFWSWRGLMYALAERLNPDTIYALSRFAYTELAMSGVTCVGEFHYVHHQSAGTPYANRTELADAVIRAATDVGIRICLIRTAYLRGGYQQPLDSAQHRFADPDVDAVLRDVDQLRQRYRADPLVTIGVAAHSIRAVPIEGVATIAAYAQQQNLPFHMHICEQRREIEECLAEYGRTPVQLLYDHGLLASNFVGIHATHLTAAEIEALGNIGCTVCLCRTTERDLGDGLPRTKELVEADVQLCVGVDSHASGDAFEEIRAVELDERSRLEARHTVADGNGLLAMGTVNGYRACGIKTMPVEDQVWLRKDEPSLAGLSGANSVDGIIFAATPRAVDQVTVAGSTIVEAGQHDSYLAALADYRNAVCTLLD